MGQGWGGGGPSCHMTQPHSTEHRACLACSNQSVNDGWVGGWMDGWTDGWMEGQVDGRKEGKMDGEGAAER